MAYVACLRGLDLHACIVVVPTDRTPPEVFFPKCWEKGDMDESLITAVHTYRSWRKLPMACSLLWTPRILRMSAKHSPTSNMDLYLEGAFLLALRILDDSNPPSRCVAYLGEMRITVAMRVPLSARTGCVDLAKPNHCNPC